jgi:hypothetical protein
VIGRRNGVVRCQCDQLFDSLGEERIAGNHERADMQTDEGPAGGDLNNTGRRSRRCCLRRRDRQFSSQIMVDAFKWLTVSPCRSASTPLH